MKLLQLHVSKYGMVENHDLNFSLEKNLHFIYGFNETGKTLTIDALCRMLLPQKPNPVKQPHKYGFKDNELNRVEYFPEGYVMLQDHQGKTHKISDKSSIFDIKDMPQKALRNIFVIRNSDLLVLGEDDFYKEVTNHISGMRIADIHQIKEKIREQNRLTGTLNFSNREKDFKLADRLQEAKQLQETIDSLLAEAEKEAYDVLEKALIDKTRQKEQLTREIEAQELASYREKYEKASESLQKLTDAQENLEKLKHYSQEELENWRNAVREHEQLQETLEADQEKLKAQQDKLEETNARLEEKRRAYEFYENKKKTLEKFEPQIESMQAREAALKGKEQAQHLWGSAWKIFAALLGVALLGGVISPEPLFLVIALLLAVPTVSLILPRAKYAREKAAFARDFTALKDTLMRYGVSGASLEEWSNNINQVKEALDAVNRELSHELFPNKKSLEKEIEDLSNRQIPELKERLNAMEDKIEGIKLNAGVDRIEDYIKKLNEKETNRQVFSNMASALESLLGKQTNDGGEFSDQDVAFWREAIKRLEDYKESAPGVTYSPQSLASMKEEKKQLESSIAEIERKISHYRDKLKDIEESARKTLYPDDSGEIFCRTVKNLETLKQRVQNFIMENEQVKNAAQTIEEIFDGIANREERKMEELFSDDSGISAYFVELTGGNYRDVYYNRENQQVVCETYQGAKIDAGKLSGFAMDQLYFSIRFALARKILDGGPGFLILDDPFIKADKNRLKKQMQLLKEVSESGWQIIYFTAKEEIEQAIRPDVEAGQAELFEM